MLTTSSITNSKLLRGKLPCPSCPSSDAYHEYDDGHGYCFSCNTYFPAAKEASFILDSAKYTYQYLPLRGIDTDTMAKYNVKTKVNEDGRPIAIGFVYPDGCTKIRDLDKKEFHWSKETEHQPCLFGRDRFSGSENRSVVITEGELDALSLYQILHIPVVSVSSASAGVRDCISDRAYLNSFERVYLAFDGDLPGREAASRVAKLFDFNKLYQIKFDKYKDANEYLQHGEDQALRALWVNAKRYQPENIVSDLPEFEKILAEAPKQGVPYPFPSLNELTYGIRTSESVLLTAQEGIGKTELMHAIEYQLLKGTTDNVGAIFLEEPKRRHLQALAGLELQRPVHLPDCGCPDSEISAALRKVVGQDGRLHVYSHFGSDDPESLLDTIRFMVTALNCRYVLLDHITMAVSGLAGDDERRALDYLSTRLEMMVKELDFALIMVSHVNDDGKTRGSRYISKVADIRIDLKRDVEAFDPVARNTTELSVSKNRFSGKTGAACKLLFNPKTYSLSEIEDDVWKPANDNFPALDSARRVA